jgi:endonuclease/exonuclease/phosphatase family metal-dependent hydrolase
MDPTPVSSAGTRPRRPGTLRIYTHNLYARRADWVARRGLLVDGLRRLDPDIALFQEEVCVGDYDQTADLVGDRYQVVHSKARSQAEGSGIAIASRWPIVGVQEIDLTAGGPPIDEYAWAALLVEIDAPPPLGRITVANHFPDAAADRECERERQAVIVADRLEQLAGPADLPVILAGDLDAEPDAASLRFLTGRQSIDGSSVVYIRAWDVAHPGQPCWTLDPANPLMAAELDGWPYRQIDHILIRCGRNGLSSLRVLGCERVHDQPVDGVFASDHYGLVADLAVR